MESKYALLIDAENVSPKYIRPILRELSKYGKVTYKRIYGDWTNVSRAGWKDSLLAHSITPIQQFRYVEGKNASDTALIIDAMDMLHSGQLDGFCVVSSDSDFTRLIERLREGGKEVIVMGEEKTPKALRNASDVFTVLEDILDDTDDIATESEKEQETSDSVSKTQIENNIIQFVSENQNKNKETGLGEVGSRLTNIYPDFDVRRYGFSLLSKFLKTLPRLEIYQIGSHQAYVRIKDNEEKKNSIYE
ncbi:MAG: NYN domain-containing protein, partial [Suipraeoptans sp.]